MLQFSLLEEFRQGKVSRQGFPQVLRTWGGGSSKLDGVGLSQYLGGAWRGLKMLSKNTQEGVHLIVKLPAISLQAGKFTKNELFHTIFQGFQLDFKLLFIVVFLGIISWKDASRFNGGGGCFSDRGASFLSGEAPHGGFFEKIRRMGGAPPMPHPLWETLLGGEHLTSSSTKTT